MKFFSRKNKTTAYTKIEPQVSPAQAGRRKVPAFLTKRSETVSDSPDVLAYHLKCAVEEILQGLETPNQGRSTPAQQEKAIGFLVKTLVRQILHRELASGRLKLGKPKQT